ncbi:hypothetical protein D7Y21_11205 [Corallococcus sp. AB045]|uniref:hypothetical protein n=1 Tax=Corallococcus sp. AB045 TaxID=2316719 RepID=UPI000ED25A29|nr:hypothetical protein [Corallococcus sp. AB045]RKH89265.1 hypothetical protein D7Y21_11205 [Corallococcus sp. AB045]
MASNDKRPAPTQPAEDFYGRPTTPRQDSEPQREGQGSTPSTPREEQRPQRPDTEEEDDEREPRRELTEADEKGIHPRAEDDDDDNRDLRLHDASGLRPYDPRERAPGASLDDMPDGDGPRSDAGTNPVSDVYRYGHPDRMPDRER